MCKIEYLAPRFGEEAHFTVVKISDKWPPPNSERIYDLESAIANNDMDKIISLAQQKAMASNEPVKSKKPRKRDQSSQGEMPL